MEMVIGSRCLESVAAALESAIFFPDMVFTEIGANGIRCCPQGGEQIWRILPFHARN